MQFVTLRKHGRVGEYRWPDELEALLRRRGVRGVNGDNGGAHHAVVYGDDKVYAPGDAEDPEVQGYSAAAAYLVPEDWEIVTTHQAAEGVHLFSHQSQNYCKSLLLALLIS